MTVVHSITKTCFYKDVYTGDETLRQVHYAIYQCVRTFHSKILFLLSSTRVWTADFPRNNDSLNPTLMSAVFYFS